MDDEAGDSGAQRERQRAPAAAGVRLPWSAVPAELRTAIEARLGDRVAEALSQPGGFSPGVAARLRLAGGGRAFVKAVGPEPNPDTPGLHRAEARIAAALPDGVPAPALLGSFEQDGWVALLFEDVDGSAPAQPWDPAELSRVLAALTELARSLTPSPIDAPSVTERFGGAFRGWQRLADSRRGGDDLAGLDPWAVRNLPALTELEAAWGPGAEGRTLAHADVRADNLLLTPTRVFLVDWPWACLSQPWLDLLALLPSVHMQGGPPPQAIFDDHPVARGADQAAVTATLAALTGFFLHTGRQPAPPGLPTVRAFQLAQGRAALTWLRDRTGWP